MVKVCSFLFRSISQRWHVIEPVIAIKPVSKSEQILFVQKVAAYMARVLALLQNSTLDLNILNTECGSELTKIIMDVSQHNECLFPTECM